MDNGSERTLADLGPGLAVVEPCLPSRRGVASGRSRAANAGGATLVPCGRRTRAFAPLEPPPVAMETCGPAASPAADARARRAHLRRGRRRLYLVLTARGEQGHGVAQHAYRPEDRRREHDATGADRKPREDPGDEQEHAAPLRDDVIDADPRKREPSDIGPETKPKSATNRPAEPHSPTGGNVWRNSCRWKSGSVPKRGRHVCSTMALSDTLPLAIPHWKRPSSGSSEVGAA
jgi:hypothetical protein